MKIDLFFEPEFDELYESYHNDSKKRELLKLEGISKEQLDVGRMSYNYFTGKIADMSVNQNANANEDFSPSSYAAEIVKGIQKLEGYFLLWRYSQRKLGTERANELIRAIWDGDIYFHDASGVNINQPYCVAFSTQNIMLEGRPYGQLPSVPPKRADSFIAQVTETVMDLSQDFCGAIAPSDMIVNYCWYAKRENLSDYEILNDFQKFVHVVNNKFRMGSESPFTNISLFDRENLEKVFSDYRYPDGTKVDIDYVMHVQELVGEWFSKGAPSGLPYRFPVTTVNISRDENGKILDERFLDWVCKTNIKKGCFNIYVNDGNKIASCCRLVNDMERMQFRSDSFGNGGMNLGSHRVCTVNLPRIALRAQGNEEVFFTLLQEQLENAMDLLYIHRNEIMKRRIESGFLKFFKPLGWLSLDMFFSTIGEIGIYEAGYFMGYDAKTQEGQDFTEKVLMYIEDFAKEASKKYKCSVNVEEIPKNTGAIAA